MSFETRLRIISLTVNSNRRQEKFFSLQCHKLSEFFKGHVCWVNIEALNHIQYFFTTKPSTGLRVRQSRFSI